MALSADDYLEKLQMSYLEYVDYLLKKYGPAKFNYFSETAYQDFKKGLRKSPGKNARISRTSEGLYCHHIDEDKQIMISTDGAIVQFDIPYDYQTKDRLVYCNLIEHAILHILISIEQQNENGNNQRLGIGGYVNFIRPTLIDWLVNGNVPNLQWQRNCYEAIKLSESESNILIQGLDNYLVNNYPITVDAMNLII